MSSEDRPCVKKNECETYLCQVRFSDNKLITFRTHFLEELEKKGYPPEECHSLFKIVLHERLGMAGHELMLNPERRVSESEILTLIADLKELKAHRPIQYIHEKSVFMGSEFFLNEHVLIPRPETEELVDWICQSAPEAKHILDIGTGSGCIAILLALRLNKPTVHACEISKGALEVAQKNAQSLGADVEFFQHDVLNDDISLGALDLLVSNPPYVLQSEKAEMAEHVLAHEPHQALFVDNDKPLLFYQAIAKSGKVILRQGGQLYFEINEAFGAETASMLAQLGYTDIELRRDINGKDRMLRALMDIPHYI